MKVPHIISLSVIIFLLAIASISSGNTVQYIYDDLGRLSKAIDDNGNYAAYEYDAVGNLVSITTTSTVGPVAILDIEPWSGSVGSKVTIYGKGFNSTISNNTVLFNGAQASIISATPNVIIGSVPAAATTGRVTIQTPLGNATSSKDFIVAQPISVSINPTIAFVSSGQSRQFTAIVTGATNTAVIWSVNGIDGGTTTIGTIVNGLYTATSGISNLGMVAVAARSAADFSKMASVPVYLNINRLASNSVSVVFAQPLQSISFGPIVSSSISVKFAQQPNNTVIGPVTATAVSVNFAQQALSLAVGPVVAPDVTVFSGPFITTINPATLSIGSTVSMTITGMGFTGTPDIIFYLNGAQDNEFFATNIQVSPNGAQITADITVSSTASTGIRLIRISSASGVSQGFYTNGNTVTVQ